MEFLFHIIDRTLIVGIISGIILDRILKLQKIKWRETSGDKRTINEALRCIRKGSKLYHYEKDWLERKSADNHFIAMFVASLIDPHDFQHCQVSISIFSKYRWFSKIRKFWKVKETILDLNGKINEIYESKPIFTLNEKSISLDSKDKLIKEFIKNVNVSLKLYFEIILIKYRD